MTRPYPRLAPLEHYLDARLDDVQSELTSLRLWTIKGTRHAALLFADSVEHQPNAGDEILSWSHSISLKLWGCAETYLIAALLGKALDAGEGPIFGRDAIPADGILRLLQTAAYCTNDERFESLIFEAFELASRRSMDDGRPGILLRMQRLKRFIEQESHNELTLERMAEVTGLTTFACLRQFKEATGMTPHAYLRECRIQSARRLLRTDRASIAAVASAAGFSDQAYFARLFKKSTGLTPVEYRRAANKIITNDFVEN